MKAICDKFKELFFELKKVTSKGSFVQNISFVFIGNLFVFVIQLLFTPIISRLFDPTSYGEFAYFNIIVTNIVFIGSFSYPSVYLIPKARVDFLYMGKAVIFSVFFFSILAVAGGFLFSISLKNFQFEPYTIILFLLLIVISTWNGVFQADCEREKEFKKLSIAKSISSLFSRISVVLYGLFISTNSVGLILGDFLRSILIASLVGNKTKKKEFFHLLFSKNRENAINILKKYIRAPKYIFPFQWLNKISTDIPQIVIGLLYSPDILGSFVFAMSLISIPIRLFENSIQPVIYQKALEKYRKGKTNLRYFFVKSLKSSFLVGLLPVLILSTISPIIFPLFFGEKWVLAGEIGLVMGLRNIFLSIQSPYLKFWNIISEEKKLLKLNIIGFFLRNGCLILPLVDLKFIWFLFFFAVANAIAFSLNLILLSFELLTKSQARNFSLILLGLILFSSTIIFFIARIIYNIF